VPRHRRSCATGSVRARAVPKDPRRKKSRRSSMTTPETACDLRRSGSARHKQDSDHRGKRSPVTSVVEVGFFLRRLLAPSTSTVSWTGRRRTSQLTAPTRETPERRKPLHQPVVANATRAISSYASPGGRCRTPGDVPRKFRARRREDAGTGADQTSERRTSAGDLSVTNARGSR
jgi:hypothetical protein